MAFGFFKKREYADQIFTNGTIYTMDPDEPNIEAVACKDGVILATGSYEELTPLIHGDTQVVDLEGKTMFPGFIQLNGAPAQRAFAQTGLHPLSWEGTGIPALMEALTRAVATLSEEDTLFFYGGDRSQLSGLSVQSLREAMDGLCSDRPLALLLQDCTVCLTNTCAAETVRAAAREDGLVQIPLDYIVSVIAPPDEEGYQAAAAAQCREAAQQGYTTVYDCNSFSYPQAIYRSALQELLMEEQWDVRYLSAYLLTRPENPAMLLRHLRQRQTECTELQGMIRCDGLHIHIRPAASAPSETAEPEAKWSFTEEELSAICVDAADMGCDLFITAPGGEALTMAASAIGAVRDSGYKKNAAILQYDDALSDEEIEEIYDYVPKEELLLWKELNPQAAGSVEEIVERLTIDSADALGMAAQLGVIRKGMTADFTVLSEDPYKKSPEDFFGISPSFTVCAGRIIHGRQ